VRIGDAQLNAPVSVFGAKRGQAVSSATDAGHVRLSGICNLRFLEIISAHGQIVFCEMRYLELARAEQALNFAILRYSHTHPILNGR
jgi:predicted phosphodiesterase